MDHILEDLGLTTLEIKIFKSLLASGPNSAGEVSRQTGIHRRNAYDALERLIKKGLVSYIKENNQRIYTINDPSIVSEKLQSKLKEWEEFMPKVKQQMSNWEQKKETLFFRGKNGIRHVFFDQIQEKQEILVFSTSIKVTHVVKHFMEKYQLLRKENNIRTRMIFDASLEKEEKMKHIKKKALTKIKYVKNFNSTSVSHYIYGNNVAIVTWKPEPFAILIRQKEIAQSYREQFELLWKE